MRSGSLAKPARYALAIALSAVLGAAALVVTARSAPTPPATAPSAGPYGLDARPAAKAFLNLPRKRATASGYEVVDAFPGLKFQDPMQLVPDPDGRHLWVAGREGTVERFENDPAATAKLLSLDIRDHCQGWDDSGLLGFALHPDFGKPDSPNARYFYCWYEYCQHPTAGPGRPDHTDPLRNRLARFTVNDAGVADPKSELVLIDQEDRHIWHNGGGMYFGPDDRFLYLTLGDEGNADDSFGNAQRVNGGLFSGVIRIDVDEDKSKSHPIPRQPERGHTAHYAIPNDNPWVGRKETLEEFYAIGLRNPHRMTYDPVSKKSFIGDVGQNQWESVQILEKGANYRWDYIEGNHPGPHRKPDAGAYIGTEHPPLWEYPHADGNTSVIGGYVYRGKRLPELFGKYVFGDNTSARIWAMDGWATETPRLTELGRMPRNGYSGLTGFGIDAAGELYMLQLGVKDGAIFKLNRRGDADDATEMPPTLSQTGAFADVAALAPAPPLVPYAVNAPFWSDGAKKTRWASVPGEAPFPDASRVRYSPTGSFTFPAGTVFVKHFDLPVDDRDRSRMRRLETRLLVRDKSGGVYGATYKWRPDNSDADLLPGSLSETYTIATAHPVGPLLGADVGPSRSPTKFAVVEGGYDVVTDGRDVGGAADQFFFAAQDRTGDFDVKVRLDAFTAPDPHAKAGLMARATDAPDSPFALVVARAQNQPAPDGQGFDFQLRPTAGAPMQRMLVGGPHAYPNTWLRLRRLGNVFAGYSSFDGTVWTQLSSQRIAMPDKVRLGLAVTARDAAGATATARFRDLAQLRTQTWYYPSSADCLSCHNAAAGYVLGVNARQLNGDLAYPSTGRTDNQLRTWAHVGLFDSKLREEDLASAPRLVPIDDPHAPLELRVRSYLDSNCAYCHRPGIAGGAFDARFETPLDRQQLFTDKVRNPMGVAHARVVSPGDPDHSILLRRVTALRASEKMPPLARNARDDAGIAAITEWVKSMPVEK